MSDYQTFMEDVEAGAITDHCTKPSFFLHFACEELDSVQGYDSEYFHEASYITQSTKNDDIHHVDGYYFSNESDNDRSSLTLIICDFSYSNDLQRMTLETFRSHFKRLRAFYTDCKKGKYDAWAPGTPKYDLMQIISKGTTPGYRGFIEENGTLNLHLISNKKIPHTPPESEYISLPTGGKLAIHYSVTDFTDLIEAKPQPIVLDFTKLAQATPHPDGIPFLRAIDNTKVDFYDSYLFVMPADALAECYGKYKTRILEQNVRVYLQKKGKVNQGIYKTIEEDPSVFFIYNNGLAITAEEIELNEEQTKIIRIHGLQVVNGGQTMASIYEAWHNKVDISGITVQVKLTKIARTIGKVIVPYISRYSNSQNAVKDTDQHSNELVQCCIEKLSRSVKTPGAIPQIWYYERMRGQYDNALLHMTESQKKDFQRRCPKDKKITPTKFAQAIMTFELMPYFVLKGEQKAYNGTAGMRGFCEMLSAVYESNPGLITQPAWFKENIAKYIFLQQARKAIGNHLKRTGNTLSTYTLAVSIYTISILVYLLRQRGRAIAFAQVWEKQMVDDLTIHDVIKVTDFITKALEERSDAAEWLKKESTWNIICANAESANLDLKYESNPLFTSQIPPLLNELAKVKAAKSTFSQEQNLVMRIFPDLYWESLHLWLTSQKADQATIDLLSKRFSQKLGTNQCKTLLDVAQKAEKNGWTPPFNPQEQIDFSIARTQVKEVKGDIIDNFITSSLYDVLVVERTCDLMAGSSCLDTLFRNYKAIQIEESLLAETPPELGQVKTFILENNKKVVIAYTRLTKESVYFDPILEVALGQIAAQHEGSSIILPYMGKTFNGLSVAQTTKLKARFKTLVQKELYKNPVTIMYEP